MNQFLTPGATSFCQPREQLPELSAIKGAREVLRTYKPKLQICLYHEPDDMWTIPETIKSFNPEYKFYLGHHSQNLFETVLYAR